MYYSSFSSKKKKVCYNRLMRQMKYFEAYLDDFNRISIYMSKQSYEGSSRFFYLQDEKGNLEELHIQSVEETSRGYNKYTCTCSHDIEVGKEYHIFHEYARKCVLKSGYIVKQPRFDELFTCDLPLGAIYTPKETIFRLWAPTAVRVDLSICSDYYPMKRKEKGIFEYTLKGNLEKEKYCYYVKVDGQWNVTQDPYGKSSLANSAYSIVIDCDKLINKKRKLPKLKSYTDAVIYEMSVRDFTAQNFNGDFEHSKKFLGVVEENDATREKKIGFSYLKDLGITHVQLMPVMDFASVDENHQNVFYNWGYDPAHFMTPEGSYCTDPNDAYARITELKTLVDKMHQAGIRVILDVVFNHVFDLDVMCLNQVVPNYYFQMNEKGAYSNGSWCGNDFDSLRSMAKKYVIDCCKYLMKMYQVDGFRFDLMGILDIDTMNEVYEACAQIDENVMIYGEGWDMPSFLDGSKRATIYHDHQMPHIAQFSDRFRDVVKGVTSKEEVYKKGYCTGDLALIDMMKDVLSASVSDHYAQPYFSEPVHVINYVECHDNQTCWDKIKECCKEDTKDKRIKRHKMCIAATLFAQGVPFLHAGQEFARTKYGQHNTYNGKDEINWIMWDRKDTYQTIVDYTKDCIQIRKQLSCMRYSTLEDVLHHVSFFELEKRALCYCMKEEKEEVIVIFNPSEKDVQYSFEGIMQLLFYDGIVENEIVNGYINIRPLSVIILKRSYYE